MGLSLGHLVIILIVVLLIFGPGRLSKVMNEFGRGIRSLRDGMKDETDTADAGAQAKEEKLREDRRLTDQRAADQRATDARSEQQISRNSDERIDR